MFGRSDLRRRRSIEIARDQVHGLHAHHRPVPNESDRVKMSRQRKKGPQEDADLHRTNRLGRHHLHRRHLQTHFQAGTIHCEVDLEVTLEHAHAHHPTEIRKKAAQRIWNMVPSLQPRKFYVTI